MGKNGDLLRLKKQESVKYTFTAAQLEEHDRFVIKQHKDRLMASLEKEAEAKRNELKQAVNDEWKSREEMFNSENFMDNFNLLLSMLLSVSSKMLVERFGWKSFNSRGCIDKRCNLYKFSNLVVNEVLGICSDENADIRMYCEDVFEKYGVKYVMEEDHDG